VKVIIISVVSILALDGGNAMNFIKQIVPN